MLSYYQSIRLIQERKKRAIVKQWIKQRNNETMELIKHHLESSCKIEK